VKASWSIASRFHAGNDDRRIRAGGIVILACATGVHVVRAREK
jgi:hypothetical protein